EPGYRRRREVADLVRCQGRPQPGLNQGDDLLAETLARPTDNDGVDDGRVPADNLFDLLDEDFLAAGVDHQRVAAEQGYRPVRQQSGPVARHGRALALDDGEGQLGPLRIVKVAKRHTPHPGRPPDLVLTWAQKSRPVRTHHGGAMGDEAVALLTLT